MSPPLIPRSVGLRIIESIEQALRDGYPPKGALLEGNKTIGAIRKGILDVIPDIQKSRVHSKYVSAVKSAGRQPDWSIKQDSPLEFPTFPSENIPTEELINRLAADYQVKQAYEESRKWFEIKVKIKGPIGIAWIGDPHLGDAGTNWPLLKHHVELIRSTPGMFAANIGDTENNWAGKLAHLYSQQETSRATERQLTEWLFSHSGMKWLVLLLGNHDVWGNNADALSRIARGGAPISDWSAQLKLVFPNKKEVKIWASHDFPGHSQWNPLHGPQKMARFTGAADLYVCGHRHNWSLFNTEDEHRGETYWLARARGYKHIDSYGKNLGYGSQRHGSTIACIIDPYADGPNVMQCFSDLEQGAQFLTYLRKRGGYD
jgi:hypothetical protein